MSGNDHLSCWLCERELGDIVQCHHPVPKAKKGKVKVKVPIHPICHKTIHAGFTNNELARIGDNAAIIRDNAAIAKFVVWIANMPADFDAPTR